LTGHFQGLTVFGNIPLAASGGSPDVFVAKYDGNGNVLWAKKAGGAGRDQGLGIAIDPFPTMSDLPVPLSHASYVTGYCTETAVFGGVSLAGSGSSRDIFVAKYDGAGNVLWAKRAGGEGSGQGLGIAVEQSSSSLDLETGAPVFASHVTGYFAGMARFGEIPWPAAASKTTTFSWPSSVWKTPRRSSMPASISAPTRRVPSRSTARAAVILMAIR
jgi:hypothetical protein